MAGTASQMGVLGLGSSVAQLCLQGLLERSIASVDKTRRSWDYVLTKCTKKMNSLKQKAVRLNLGGHKGRSQMNQTNLKLSHTRWRFIAGSFMGRKGNLASTTLYIFYFFKWKSGVEPMPPAVEAQCLNPWTRREFPLYLYLEHGVYTWDVWTLRFPGWPQGDQET